MVEYTQVCSFMRSWSTTFACGQAFFGTSFRRVLFFNLGKQLVRTTFQIITPSGSSPLQVSEASLGASSSHTVASGQELLRLRGNRADSNNTKVCVQLALLSRVKMAWVQQFEPTCESILNNTTQSYGNEEAD
jgi:hypothetical protein